jgi:hypothetical protein
MTKTEKATQWMEQAAANSKHGYSQVNRWGPDYDCSSAVITAWQKAGVPVKSRGATYTGNMYNVFLSCGFRDVTKKVNLATCLGMKRSDVLLNHVHHTAMYCGNGRIVHARGQSYGSAKTGDQGQEFAVTDYYNYPWDCVLRFSESADQGGVETVPSGIGVVGTTKVTSERKLLIIGAIDPDVALVQFCLRQKGYKGKDGKALEIDGELGDNTAYAITQLQKKAGMKNINFGTVAGRTWELLLK